MVHVEAEGGEGAEDLGHLGALVDLVQRDALGGGGVAAGNDRGGGRGGGDGLAGLVEDFGGDDGDDVGVEVLLGEPDAAGGLVAQEDVGLFVALANAGEVARQLVGGGVALVEVAGQRGAVAGDAGAKAIEGGKELDDLINLSGGEDMAIAHAGEDDVLGAEFEEDAVELFVVVHVLLTLLALDAVKRGLGDVDVAALEQALHLAIDEGEEEGADVGAVHVGVRHDDDFVVAGLVGVEAADGLAALADAGADGGDEGPDFLVGENLVETGLLGVDQLAAEREDGLEAAVAALFGGAASGVALDDVDLAQGGVALGAVCEFAGEAAAGEGALADGLAGFTGGLASAGSVEGFINDAFADLGVGFEILGEALVAQRADDALDLGGEEFDLGLGFELGVGVLNRNDGGEAFAHIVAGDLGIPVLDEIICPGESIDGAGQGAAEAGEVGAAIGIMDGVGVAEDLIVVSVVVLEDDLDVDLDGFVIEGGRHFFMDTDGSRVERLLAGVELPHELDDAVLVIISLDLGDGGALVGEDDLEAGVKEGELAEALGDGFEDEDGGEFENLGVGLERDGGAGAGSGADDLKFFDHLALGELHVVDMAAAGDLDLEPLGDGVDALGADAVSAAGELVAALTVFAAGVEGGEHHLDAGNAVNRVDVHRDATAVVSDGDGAINVDGDVDLFAMAGEMLVHGVVQNLGYAVVEGALVGATDIHAGLFTDGLEALEFAELGRVVISRVGGVGERVELVGFGRRLRVGGVGHFKRGNA